MLWWLFNNLVTNLNRREIGTDFGFLSRGTNFQIPYDEGFDPQSPVRDMVLVGVKNTFLAGFGGIMIATLLGVLIGVSRLSSNWLLARLAMVYVETFRNIPPLIIIIFFGFAVVHLRAVADPVGGAPTVSFLGTDHTVLILSNDDLGSPQSSPLGPTCGSCGGRWLVGPGGGDRDWCGAPACHERTGSPIHRVRWTLGAFVLLAGCGILLLGDAFAMSWPELAESRTPHHRRLRHEQRIHLGHGRPRPVHRQPHRRDHPRQRSSPCPRGRPRRPTPSP